MRRKTGFVTRTGQKLYLDGAPYTFTGLNMYNANSRWNCAGPLDLADALVQSGARTIRAWFFQSLATTDGARDWAAFDKTLAVARAAKVKVIVTLADQWGACESPGLPSLYKDADWYRSGYWTAIAPGTTKPYRDWVTEIVTRYRSDPTILMWQLMNEAETMAAGECSEADLLKTWATDMARLVKSIDAKHLLSLGTMGGGQCGAVWLDYQSLHDIPEIDLCEYHDYAPEPMPGDEWNGLAFRLQQAKALGKPLFVGEVGIPASDPDRAAKFAAKKQAQFTAGIVGWLPWAWDIDDTYRIGPGDPTLEVLR